MKTIQYRRDFWKLLKDLNGGAAEIGVAEGRYSKEILEWPIDIPKLFLVDRWECDPNQKGDGGAPQEWHDHNLGLVLEMLKPFERWRYQIMRGDSHQMASFVDDQSLRFVYIDCDHSYEGVMRDTLAWTPKLVKGGICAWHDYENPSYGVKEAVEQFCRERNYAINLVPEDKWEDAGAWIRI